MLNVLGLAWNFLLVRGLKLRRVRCMNCNSLEAGVADCGLHVSDSDVVFISRISGAFLELSEGACRRIKH